MTFTPCARTAACSVATSEMPIQTVEPTLGRAPTPSSMIAWPLRETEPAPVASSSPQSFRNPSAWM